MKKTALPSITSLLIAASPLAQAQDNSDPPIEVTVTEVRSEAVSPGIPAAGTVFSRNAAQITAGLDARLLWVAEPGDFVPEGQPVARFDCEMLDLQRQEQVAQADRERIRFDSLSREIERLERASMSTSVMQQERVKADRDFSRGEIQVAEVRIRQTEKALERCTETAPFSGVITRQLRRGGEDVPRGEVLAAMTDVNHLEVRASVPIRHLPRMSTGVIAEVRLGEVRMEGLLRTAVPAADPTSQTFEVRIDLPTQAPTLVAAGQLVSVQLPLTAHPALTVPRDSIVLRADGAYVMRIDATNRVAAVPVEVSDGSGDKVSVSGDLTAGDRVAVRGAEALDDGETVAILVGP